MHLAERWRARLLEDESALAELAQTKAVPSGLLVDYHLDATFSPDREWLDGRARVKIRVKSYALAALTLRLANEFNVTSITSDKLGRLMFLRVRNQNDVVINLPSAVPRDLEMTLTIAYAGPIPCTIPEPR